MVVRGPSASLRRARARSAAAFVVTSLLALAPAAVAQDPSTASRDDSIAREWRVRAIALDPEGARADWLRAAASERWTDRFEALDGLQRSAASGVLQGAPRDVRDDVRELARRAVTDDHPNLVGLGAALLVAQGGADDASPADVERLVTSVLAETRARAAELVAARRLDPAARTAWLRTLSTDADLEVREAARRGLVNVLLEQGDGEEAVAGTVDVLLESVAAVHARLGEDAAVRILAPLEGVPADTAKVLNDLASAFAGPRAPFERQRVAALARVAAAAAGAPLRPDELVDLWCASPVWSPARDALFTAAAARLGDVAVHELMAGAELALEVFARDEPHADRLDERTAQRRDDLRALLASEPEADHYPFASVLLRAALAAGGPGPFIDELIGAGDALLAQTLRVLGPALVAAWTPERVQRMAEHARRADLVRELEEVWVLAARDGDDVAADELARRLGSESDPERRRELFRALGRLPDPSGVAPELGRIFNALDQDTALEVVAFLPRAALDAATRDRLVDLGRRRPDRRGSIARVLRAAPSDEETLFQVERWVVEVLAELEDASGLDARRAFDRASELIPALGAIGGADATPTLVTALEWSVGRDPRIGRIAARALGADPLGRAALRERLSSPLDREVRTEVALALVGPDVPRAEFEGDVQRLVELLVADGTDGRIDDGTRRVVALARVDTAAAIEALLAFAADPEAPISLGTSAIDALASSSVDPGRVAELARDMRDFDRRRSALRALETLGAGDLLRVFTDDWNELEGAARSGLVEVWGDGSWPRRVLGLDLELPGQPEELAVVTGELAAATARLGVAAEGWEAHVLDRALAEAADNLRARFAGDGLSDPAFRYWSELELFDVAARTGLAEALLDGSGPWERLDARLLVELSQRALRAGEIEPALRLGRAALVAALGEGPGSQGVAIRATELAADASWRAERYASAAALYSALVDPFVERPIGRGQGQPTPLSGGSDRVRAELARRVAWSRALEAAGRGDGDLARVQLERAERLARADPRAVERHAEVVGAVRARLSGDGGR
ncbi:hypothetical protein Pla163_07760 [Planctomycetes bacterium Pla163]|uniref:HEAT repeat protein n=2 Tax=Rohdeia mirabilis TaxID=2528008 RepID=A0A518CWT5_9BACT|nr:hypothetical protein Pla163_07760 [Planctomycetes bacterium Pla163]